MKTLTGKRAVVTGAAAGIGKAIATELAKAGCHVWLLDRDREALTQARNAVQQHGVEARELTCDVGNPTMVDRVIDELLDTWPEIDIVVNNAGMVFRGSSAEMMSSDWEQLLAVNLLGPIQICQRLLPTLLSRPESHLLNVGSLLGLCGLPKFAAYSASKFGLVGYSEALRAEYLGSQLGVTAVCPGFVRTAFIEAVPSTGGTVRRRSIPRWLSTTPEVVARKSVKAIRANRGLVVATPLAHLTWRLKRYLPLLFEVRRLRKTRRIAPPSSVHRPSDSIAAKKAA